MNPSKWKIVRFFSHKYPNFFATYNQFKIFRFYRAIGYMRPLSIWAMQWSLKKHCGLNTSQERLPKLPTASTSSIQEKEEDAMKRMTVETSASEDSSSLGYVSDYREESKISTRIR